MDVLQNYLPPRVPTDGSKKSKSGLHLLNRNTRVHTKRPLKMNFTTPNALHAAKPYRLRSTLGSYVPIEIQPLFWGASDRLVRAA